MKYNNKTYFEDMKSKPVNIHVASALKTFFSGEISGLEAQNKEASSTIKFLSQTIKNHKGMARKNRVTLGSQFYSDFYSQEGKRRYYKIFTKQKDEGHQLITAYMNEYEKLLLSKDPWYVTGKSAWKKIRVKKALKATNEYVGAILLEKRSMRKLLGDYYKENDRLAVGIEKARMERERLTKKREVLQEYLVELRAGTKFPVPDELAGADLMMNIKNLADIWMCVAKDRLDEGSPDYEPLGEVVSKPPCYKDHEFFKDVNLIRKHVELSESAETMLETCEEQLVLYGERHSELNLILEDRLRKLGWQYCDHVVTGRLGRKEGPVKISRSDYKSIKQAREMIKSGYITKETYRTKNSRTFSQVSVYVWKTILKGIHLDVGRKLFESGHVIYRGRSAFLQAREINEYVEMYASLLALQGGLVDKLKGIMGRIVSLQEELRKHIISRLQCASEQTMDMDSELLFDFREAMAEYDHSRRIVYKIFFDSEEGWDEYLDDDLDDEYVNQENYADNEAAGYYYQEAGERNSEEDSYIETDEEKACRILGVPASATEYQVTRMYRALATVWHPDVHSGNDASHMAEINWAYDYLTKQRGFK